MRTLSAFLRRFHRDRSGSYTLIAVFGAIPFIFLVIQILNLGGVNMDRMRAQNAADAIAQTHAQWTARSLNAISMNNVTMTQTAAVATASAAMHGALVELGLRGTGVAAAVARHGVQECKTLLDRGKKLADIAKGLAATVVFAELAPLAEAASKTAYAFGAICIAEHSLVIIPALTSVAYAGWMEVRFGPMHGVRSSNRATDALSAVNERIAERAPEEIGRILRAVARANGADAFHVHRDCAGVLPGERCGPEDANLAMPLPLARGDLRALPEFCFQSNGRLMDLIGTGRIGEPVSHLDLSRIPGIGKVFDKADGSDNAIIGGIGGWSKNADLRILPKLIGKLEARLIGMNGYATMEDRGFPDKKSPFSHGGQSTFPYLPDTIVRRTRLSMFIHGFDRFYRQRNTMGKIVFGIGYLPSLGVVRLPEYALDLIALPPGRTGAIGYSGAGGRFVLSIRDLALGEERDGDAGGKKRLLYFLEDYFKGAALNPEDATNGRSGDTIADRIDKEEKTDNKCNPENIRRTRGPGDEVNQRLLYVCMQRPPAEYDNNFFTRLTIHWLMLCEPFPGEALSMLARIGNFGAPPISKPTVFYPEDGGSWIVPRFFRDPSEMPAAFKPLVFVWHAPDLRIGSTAFFALPGRGAYAVAEGMTSNVEGFDFYSQTWQGGLAPVSQLDDLGPVIETMEDIAPDAFDPLLETYRAARRGGRAVGALHAH